MDDVFVLSLFCFAFSLENLDFTGIFRIVRSVTLLNKLQLNFIWVSNSPCDATSDKSDWDFFTLFFSLYFFFWYFVLAGVKNMNGSVILIPGFFKFWALYFFFIKALKQFRAFERTFFCSFVASFSHIQSKFNQNHCSESDEPAYPENCSIVNLSLLFSFRPYFTEACVLHAGAAFPPNVTRFVHRCMYVCAHRRCVLCLWHRSPNLELNLIYCVFAEQKTNEDIFCIKAQKVQIISWIWCEARVIQIFQPLAMEWSFLHVVPLTETMRCRAEWCTQASIVSISQKTNDDEQRRHLID